jgi:hypothetical protein
MSCFIPLGAVAHKQGILYQAEQTMNISRIGAIFAFLISVCCGCANARPSLQFDSATGLFIIKHHTVDIAKANFVFWSNPWVWVGPKVESKSSGSLNYEFSARNKEQGLAFEGKANLQNTDHLEWYIHVKPGPNQFGGLSFGFQHAPFAQESFVPKLDILPTKNGWSLKLEADQEPIKVTLDPMPSDVIFERNQHDEVRMYFAKPGEELTERDYTLSVTLPTDADVLPATTERLATPDQTWYNDLLQTSNSPVDLSFMNASELPAGKRGRLGVKADKLVFEDGTIARFWGANLTAYSLFTTGLSETVSHAKRLSKLGFNLVRLHHADSAWVVPNIIATDTASGVELNKDSMRRLDWWIKSLGDEGIYVWLDLNVGRVFPTEGLYGAAEMIENGKPPISRGYAYLNSGIQDKMKAFNALLLNHVNQYTNLAYRDDPRIAFLLLTNENDLTQHYGNMFLPDKKRPEHAKLYRSQAASFAADKKLDPDLTWKSWLYGPSKLFLGDLEHRFNETMIDDLRKIGTKALVSTTNSFGAMTVAGLPSLTDGDILSANAYAESGILEGDPKYISNLTSWLASAGVAGKPFAITEWNLWMHPSYDRSSLPAYMASVASLQDWNAPMEFAYSQSTLDTPGRVLQWEMAYDPSLLAMMAVGALIFRQQHVKPGETLHYLSPKVAEFIDKPLSPVTSRAIRTLTETVRWRVALPAIKELSWFTPSAINSVGKTVSDMSQNFAGSGDTVCAETGDFCRNWKRGTFSVDTPMTQLASGWIGGESFTLKSSKIDIKTANAAVAIQSLDSKPIANSRHILVSMAAQTMPAWKDNKTIRSEPVIGTVKFEAPPGLVGYAVFGDGRQKPFAASYENGSYRLALDSALGTYWIVFKSE